jgi:hypothetical protein
VTEGRTEWDSSYGNTRDTLHVVAVHVLARRRFPFTGRFGLRPTPGGFGTPMFGDDEALRVSGTFLVRDRRSDKGSSSTALAIPGTSLTDLARFADVDLSEPFAVGRDTPAIDDADEPLAITAPAAATVAEWYAFGARALDRLVGRLGSAGDAAMIELWPEHFDVATDVAVGDTRANVGASPGDGYIAAPYLYIGPHSHARPGDPSFWNAPFGAVVAIDEIDDDAGADAFFARGLALLADDGP